MESLLRYLFNSATGSVFLAVMASAIYAVTLMTFFNRAKDKRRTEEKRFITALNTGFENNTITDFNDIENIYKAVRNVNANDDELNKARLARWLRSYLLSIVENSDSNKSENVNQVKDKISAFIQKAEMESPHAGLPDLERSILRDMDSYIQSSNSDGAKRKLDEMATAIQVREESVTRLQSITKWSVPLSVIGLILTILFGVLSIVK